MDRDEVMISLGRIEAKLDSLADLPARVSKLEIWQGWLKGGLAAVYLACTTVLAYLVKKVA